MKSGNFICYWRKRTNIPNGNLNAKSIVHYTSAQWFRLSKINFCLNEARLAALRDSYILEVLDIPEQHKEVELRKTIVANLRDFILEFGKDFTFVGEEYPIQVGNAGFATDLLFYNYELSCLVAIEPKIDRFKLGHLDQLEFYLEALDLDIKKPNENPSVGLILCSKKQRSGGIRPKPLPIPRPSSQIPNPLPPKILLANKLRELREIA